MNKRDKGDKVERNALSQILDKLPNCSDWIDVWEEYERGNTPESQFVRQIDQLEMVLQASVYEHQELANLSEFFTSTHQAFSTPQIQSIFQAIENLRNNSNSMSCQTICNDCAFHVKNESGIECIHPDELGVNCAIVTFCSSFQPAEEIDSPCVTFGQEE